MDIEVRGLNEIAIIYFAYTQKMNHWIFLDLFVSLYVYECFACMDVCIAYMCPVPTKVKRDLVPDLLAWN